MLIRAIYRKARSPEDSLIVKIAEGLDKRLDEIGHTRDSADYPTLMKYARAVAKELNGTVQLDKHELIFRFD